MKPVSYAHLWDNYAQSLVTPGRVSRSYYATEGTEHPVFTDIQLLWDTGAVVSMISTRLVRKLGLVQTGIGKSFNSHCEVEVGCYEVNLVLPNKVEISGLTVIADTLPDTDFLVGMDVINLCDFAITHPQRQTKFAIQTPSVADIQF